MVVKKKNQRQDDKIYNPFWLESIPQTHILKLGNQVCSDLEDRHGQTINNKKLWKFTEAIEMWEKF